VDAAAEDDKECDTAADISVTHSEPMEDCSVTANSASNTESVEMAECNTVYQLLLSCML